MGEYSRLHLRSLGCLLLVCSTVATPSPGAPAVRGTAFVVTNTNDEGAGSLRRAIEDANAAPGADAIAFAIPGGGVHRIAPESPLPAITSPVTIDGTTQPGFAGSPLVELDGIDAGESNGLVIEAGDSVVRGLVINRFSVHGIEIVGDGGNVVEGNYLGTDATGTAACPNGEVGVIVFHSANNRIGGTSPASRNVISANLKEGVLVEGPESSGNVVSGNYVGTNAAGSAALGNNLVGLLVAEAPGNTIVGNVVSGNGYEGVAIEGEQATGNTVVGNLIGTGADGRAEIPNTFAGIAIDQGAHDNTIGGTVEGEGNVLAFNLADGIEVTEGRANRILGNRIFGNRGIGITLGGREIGMNDDGDADEGPNDLQNYPVLRSATSAGAMTTVTGDLSSEPSTVYRVELFANAECDQYGFGEGETLLTSLDVATDATGTATFTVTVAAAPGAFISATATDREGNTSELSSCVRVALSWDPPDPQSGANPPPRNLSVAASSGLEPATAAAPRGPSLLGYKVYGSTVQGQPPSPGTLITSVPPNQTSANVPAGPGGSFFVVTAVYDTGESGPSNEAEGGQPPEVASFKVKGRKIVADGAGFTDSVLVIVDGLPFAAPAKGKKRNTRVVQTGMLITGQSLAEYLASRRPAADGSVRVLVGFRNATGGVATVEHRFEP
jgi:parallel beta-helix repeat protein